MDNTWIQNTLFLRKSASLGEYGAYIFNMFLQGNMKHIKMLSNYSDSRAVLCTWPIQSVGITAFLRLSEASQMVSLAHLILPKCDHLHCLKWWNQACFQVPIPATAQSQPEPRPKARPPLPKTPVERKLRSTDQKDSCHYPNRTQFQFMTFRVRVTAANDSSLGKDLTGSWGCGDGWPALLWSHVCQTDQHHKIQRLFLS